MCLVFCTSTMAGNRFHNVPLGSGGISSIFKRREKSRKLYSEPFPENKTVSFYGPRLPNYSAFITADSTGSDKEYRTAVITHI